MKSELPPQALDAIDLFQQALERYFARDWRAARALFERSASLELLQPGRDPGVRTNPSRVYLRIVDRMAQQQPPEDWDGTYAMTEK
jgi:adenylate cyclase